MNILICEDEKPALNQISRHIKSIRSDANIVATVETGEEAKEAIENLDLDLIFMDVELADGPCFETLGKVEITTPIIFTTAYDKYALKAFKLKSIDYLVKPISKMDVERAFSKYEEMKNMFKDGGNLYFQSDENKGRKENEKDLVDKLEVFIENNFQKKEILNRLFIKTNETINIVSASDIQWIEATGNYINIITANKKFILRSTLKGIAKRLDPEKFFQIHKSTIINIEYIEKMEEMAYGDYKVILKNGEELKMSRNFKDLIRFI